MTSRSSPGTRQNPAAGADLGAALGRAQTPQSALQPNSPEPIWPHPQPYTANLLRRLARGLSSWFGLLNEWDFRIGIGSIRCFGLELVLVNKPALVRQVLVEEPDSFPKHPYTQWILEPLIGRGIFAVNGAEWQRQRRLIDQALQAAQLRRVFPLMEGAVQAMLQRFDSQIAAQIANPTAGPITNPITDKITSQSSDQAQTTEEEHESKESDLRFDAQEAMTLVTADVIVRTILSRPLHEEEATRIFAAFARYQRRAGRLMLLRFLRLPRRWLQPMLQADAQLIRSWIATAIAERQRSRCSSPGSGSGGPDNAHKDLLDALEQADDHTGARSTSATGGATAAARVAPMEPTPGAGEAAVSGSSASRFSQEELIDQVCVLFLAGHETSASALAMACYLLARYPEAQARFAEEIEQVRRGPTPQDCADRPRRPLGYDDLRRLPFGTALLQETLRLYPPLSFFIRKSQAQSQLGESRCPMGALLVLSPWVIQRHEQHWSEPNSFRPERFLADQANDAEKQWARDAYLPFGLGPRKCPGAAFALQEALLVLAELVSRYELRGEPGQEPQLVGNLTLRSRNGVKLRLHRRKDAGTV